MKQTVIGLFHKSADAQEAMRRLLSNGFTTDDVDMSLSYDSSEAANTNFDLDDDRHEHESGIARFFRNLFGDEDEDAHRYSRAANKGKSIVTVHARSDDQAHKAADILDDCGAIDVNESNDEYSDSGASPVGVFNETTGTNIMPPPPDIAGEFATTDVRDDEASDKKIPIIEENLEVGKRTVQTGGVRLKSRIVEKPVEEELRLRQERVYVQRNEVNRPASESDFANFKEGETEYTESGEVPVVNKEARVVEEVSIGKNVDEHSETVRDTVRKTEVDIDNLENKSRRDDTWRDNS